MNFSDIVQGGEYKIVARDLVFLPYGTRVICRMKGQKYGLIAIRVKGESDTYTIGPADIEV